LSQKVGERRFGDKENGQKQKSDSKLLRFGEHVNARGIVIEEIELVKDKMRQARGAQLVFLDPPAQLFRHLTDVALLGF